MQLDLTPPDNGPTKSPEPAPDQLVGVTKFAQEIGVSRNAVYKRIAAGTLSADVIVENGATKKIWLNAGRAAWIRDRDPRADLHDGAPNPTADPAIDPASPPAPRSPAADSESGAFRDAKTRAAQVQAEKAALELARMRDELRHKDEIAAAVQTVFMKLREALMDRFPTNADDLVAAAESGGVPAVRQMLADIGKRTCEQLAENLQRIAESDRDFDQDAEFDG